MIGSLEDSSYRNSEGTNSIKSPSVGPSMLGELFAAEQRSEPKYQLISAPKRPSKSLENKGDNLLYALICLAGLVATISLSILLPVLAWLLVPIALALAGAAGYNIYRCVRQSREEYTL